MSNLDDKFLTALEEIKECFVVAQAMAKSSIKIGLERDDLLAALRLTMPLYKLTIGLAKKDNTKMSLLAMEKLIEDETQANAAIAEAEK